MIGSPDLLAFTSTVGFGEAEEEQGASGLPEELSVPLFPPSNPWTSAAQFHRDFVLVAEFSEQVGPKPVLTIPDDPRVIGTFDLNHFSVRIMSVDYQASGPAHTHTPAAPGLRLNFSEDSRVILGDSAEDAFAYVHHLTLYDLEARGMVRPFCMAYICSDLNKIMENFFELSSCFSLASDSLKTGNRQAFSMELQRKLQELEFTRMTLRQDAERIDTVNGFSVAEEKANELEAVERSILNHKDLLRQVTSYPNRKLKQPDFLPYDPAASLTDPAALLPPQAPTTATTTATTTTTTTAAATCRSEQQLKPLQELCNPYFLSLMKEQLADTESRLRGDRCVLQTARITHTLSRRLTLTNFLFELWSPEEDEEEEEPQKMKSGAEAFQSEPMSLESFCSCVEEIQIKMEAGDTATDPLNHSIATEMTGSVSSGDSIEVLGTEKSYRTQRVVYGSDSRGVDSSLTSAVTSPDSVRRSSSAADGGCGSVRRVRAFARRANSEDSIEVLSTTESIFPDDLTAITEEEAEPQPLSNGLDHDDKTLKSDDMNGAAPGNKDEDDLRVQKEDEEHVKKPSASVDVTIKVETVKDCLKTNEDDGAEKTSRLLQVKEEVESVWSEAHHKLTPDFHMRPTPPVSLVELDSWSSPGAPFRLLSVDEASDCTSFTGSSDTPSPTQHILSSSSSHLERRRKRRKAAMRALKFLRHNSFSQHAMFCLLSGRPLAVVGSNEALVRKMVDALSLFLPAPGPDGNAVMPCVTTALQLSDLLQWRLIGVHRSSSSSSLSVLHSLTRYSRYVALFDLDQRTLRCPSYSGSLLSRLANPQTSISRGFTFLLHLESSLTALTNHALMVTFLPASRQEDAATAVDGEEDLLRQSVCSSDSDLKVMNFLSDLIKRRHAGRGPPSLRFYYSSVQLHKNTALTPESNKKH